MYFRLKPCHFSHLRVTMSLFLCAPQLYTIMENENQPSLTDQIRKLLEGVPDDKLNSVLDSLILERKEEKAKREKSRAIEKLVTAFLEDEDVKRFYVQAKPEAQDKFLQEYVDEIKRQCAEVDYSLHSLSNHIHENNPSPSDSGNNRKGSQGSEDIYKTAEQLGRETVEEKKANARSAADLCSSSLFATSFIELIQA